MTVCKVNREIRNSKSCKTWKMILTHLSHTTTHQRALPTFFSSLSLQSSDKQMTFYGKQNNGLHRDLQDTVTWKQCYFTESGQWLQVFGSWWQTWPRRLLYTGASWGVFHALPANILCLNSLRKLDINL